MTILGASNIRKSFAGVQALKDVSFELRSGEVHALVGENGAGKSTLIKVMTGAVAPDFGSLTVFGHPLAHNSPAVSRALGIAPVYQQPALFPHLTVAENIGLALEPHGLFRRIDWKQRDRHARDLLERAGARIDPSRLVSTLSMSEQQIVEIAKAIGSSARILILDEPTASLTEREAERLFRVVGDLRASGAGIVYISHRLDEILEIGDRVTVLRDGRNIATCAMAEVDRPKLIQFMVGREVSAVFPKRSVPIGETILEARNLGCAATGLRGISFSVHRGEILGIAGLVGSGRTELAQALFGIAPADSGEVLLHGNPVRIGAPVDAIRLKIGYVPEDRRQHGVVLQMPICANVTMAALPSISPNGLIDSAAENHVAAAYVDRLQIKTPSIHTEAGALSGGNQQKVALARWLNIAPSLLILDEPTQGVDVGAKSEIHSLMVDLAERGMAIIMISSEMPEILGMSDRIAVMHSGAIAGILSREDADQAKILALALGHGPAPSTERPN
jgi:rhamnose transport system ATP-binding protein